jgi:hypothetical protein
VRVVSIDPGSAARGFGVIALDRANNLRALEFG